jgi:hypothetical protein
LRIMEYTFFNDWGYAGKGALGEKPKEAPELFPDREEVDEDRG